MDGPGGVPFTLAAHRNKAEFLSPRSQLPGLPAQNGPTGGNTRGSWPGQEWIQAELEPQVGWSWLRSSGGCRKHVTRTKRIFLLSTRVGSWRIDFFVPHRHWWELGDVLISSNLCKLQGMSKTLRHETCSVDVCRNREEVFGGSSCHTVILLEDAGGK